MKKFLKIMFVIVVFILLGAVCFRIFDDSCGNLTQDVIYDHVVKG